MITIRNDFHGTKATELAARWIEKLPLEKRDFAQRFEEEVVGAFEQELESGGWEGATDAEILASVSLEQIARSALCLDADSTPEATEAEWAELLAEAEEFAEMGFAD